MTSINGKWNLVSTENFIEYCKEIGTTGDYLEQAKVLELTGEGGLIEEYNYDGAKTMFRKVTTAGGKITREQTLPVGTEASVKSADDKDTKMLLTVVGDVWTRVDKGDGYESILVATIAGDEMTAELSAGNVKCLRKFKRI